ncbi:MAG TPA: 4Fe-4S dicluster domain-containing protein, partial [Acidothermaceae bacterium]|nr:4Fe-4S dicluster domain-containing protein [Acidothermaceae bacterium]
MARNFQVTRCNQCAKPPCVTACPTAAMFQRPDGIVDFDKSVCIGCKACIAACPYDAIFINPEDHSAEKCNFCAHRIDVGLEPACVVVCPTEAIAIGNLNDPTSRVAQIVNRGRVQVRRPEKDTQPKLFYVDGHEATLDPLAARQPDGGQYMWSQQVGDLPHPTRTSSPGNSSAAAIVSYDVSHHAPWDWRVSLYTWTKSIATGAYLVPLLLVLTGVLKPQAVLWHWLAPVVAGVFLVVTGIVLIADLAHPERFYLIMVRPQWRSWLTRGAFIITGFGTVLAVHVLLSLLGVGQAQLWLAILGAPLAILSAIYTAYLFAQAKARDLWQNPLLPAHLLVQALLAGASVYLLASSQPLGDALTPLAWILAGAAVAHL